MMVGAEFIQTFQLKPLTTMDEWEIANRWLLYFKSELFCQQRMRTAVEYETLKIQLSMEEVVQLLQILINHYDRNNWVSESGDVVKEIRLRMKQRGVRNRDLVEEVGSRGYVSDILNRRKPISMRTARIFASFFDIPAEWFFNDDDSLTVKIN